MIMYHLGPHVQLGVWIVQVSTFSSVLINRFHCINIRIFDKALYGTLDGTLWPNETWATVTQ